jgi:predicted O-methyltransferase YrrM
MPTADKRWSEVDEYFNSRLIEPDEALANALKASDAAGLPSIHVAPNQGKLLMLLARMHGARAILELGTLAGYSTIWLARALPEDGRLVTLEVNPHHAEVAMGNIAGAGVGSKVELRVGPAMESLEALASAGKRFDFVFMDADKVNYPGYWEWSVRLANPGGVIVADNVVRTGAVVDPHSNDANVIGVRAFTELVANDSRVTATALQTVGSKGYDGFILALVH